MHIIVIPLRTEGRTSVKRQVITHNSVTILICRSQNRDFFEFQDADFHFSRARVFRFGGIVKMQ